MMDQLSVLVLLKKDHDKVKELLAKLAQTNERSSKVRGELLSELEAEMTLHARLEEEIFYPAYRAAVQSRDDRRQVSEGTEVHALVRQLIAQLKDTPPEIETFAARAKILRHLIEYHAEEEEDRMFSQARRVLGENILLKLGRQLEARKEALLQGNTATATATPPTP